MFKTTRGLFALIMAIFLLPIPSAFAQTTDTTCEILVYGDSLAGVGAAVAAAAQGAEVCLLATIGYAGGQASAAGVSTMDEGDISLRSSGLYAQLVDELAAYYGPEALSAAYFGRQTGASTIGAEPVVIKDILERWLKDAGVRVYPYIHAVSVLQDESGAVVGLADEDGRNWLSRILIDASEWQELYPLISGLHYAVGDGSCVQDITWTVSMKWYPDGLPDHLWVPLNTYYQLKSVYGRATVDGWLSEFRRRVGKPGEATEDFPGWDKLGNVLLSFDAFAGYRGTADKRELIAALDGQHPVTTRTALNWSNDMRFLLSALSKPSAEITQYRLAQDKTLLFLWYLRRELQETHWGIADDQGFESVRRPFNNPLIADRLERSFPPLAYVREGRRLTNTASRLTYRDLADEQRGKDRWPDSVMTGAYFSDTHSCALPPEQRSGYGLYDVPLGIFIPLDVDGFLPGMVRGAGVDRAAASSLRMQPTELIGGQVVGTLAAASISSGLQPREIPVDRIRALLSEQGVMIDVP